MTSGARTSVRGRWADRTVAQGHRMSKTKISLSSTGCNRSAVSCGLISPNQSVFLANCSKRGVRQQTTFTLNVRQTIVPFLNVFENHGVSVDDIHFDIKFCYWFFLIWLVFYHPSSGQVVRCLAKRRK